MGSLLFDFHVDEGLSGRSDENTKKVPKSREIIVAFFWYTLYFPLGIMTISRHLMVSRKQEISPVADLSPPGLFLVLVSKW